MAVYHPKGHLRAALAPGVRHVQRLLADPAYRTYHQYCWKLRRTPRFSDGMVMFKGKRIWFVDCASFLSAWDEIFVNRVYDPGELGKRPVLIDAGANIGLAALYWKYRYGEIDYLAFEPDPHVADSLRRNLIEWGVEAEVRCSAVGSDMRDVEFRPDHADAGFVAQDVPLGGDKMIVRMERLSGFLHRPVDLLKIDVEGAEVDVIREIEGSLQLVRHLFVEVHEWSGSFLRLATVTEALERAGFALTIQVQYSPPEPWAVSPARNGRFEHNISVFGRRKDKC